MMAPEVGHAQIDEALTIQPIEVCDPSGGCATPSFDFGTMQQVLTSVWAQAGIAAVARDVAYARSQLDKQALCRWA
jgi:hypothetical protein